MHMASMQWQSPNVSKGSVRRCSTLCKASTGRQYSIYSRKTPNAPRRTLGLQHARSTSTLDYGGLLDEGESIMDAATSMNHPAAKLLVMQTRERLSAAVKAEDVRP